MFLFCFFRLFDKFAVGATILVLGLSSCALKAESQLKFEQITDADGLISNTVFDIVEDKRGFLWFATQEGLQRYDGNDFRSFIHDPSNINSLSNDWVKTLLVDLDGNIWVGTANGLNIYVQEKEQFVLFDFHESMIWLH